MSSINIHLAAVRVCEDCGVKVERRNVDHVLGIITSNIRNFLNNKHDVMYDIHTIINFATFELIVYVFDIKALYMKRYASLLSFPRNIYS